MIIKFVQNNWKWLVPTLLLLIFFLWKKENNKPVAKRIADVKAEAKT